MGSGTYNREIITRLTAQDVAMIAVAGHQYREGIKDKEKFAEQINHCAALTNRLGGEISRYPQNDFSGRSAVDERIEVYKEKLQELMQTYVYDIDEDGMPKRSMRSLLEMWEEVRALV